MTLESALRGARVFDLSHPMVVGMPQSPNHVAFTMAMTRRHGDLVRRDGSTGAAEMVIMSGHTGTHLDALSHVALGGRMYGGVDAGQALENGRFSALGVETVPPIVARAVLIDVARACGVGCLPAGYGIHASTLKNAADESGVIVKDGDVVLVRTGWGEMYWDDAEAFIGLASGVPGVDEDGAAWLASLAPLAVGSDTMAVERIQPGAGHGSLPVHRDLIGKRGIYLMEMLNLGGLAEAEAVVSTLVAAPLALVGATGAPIRPLAFVE